MISRLISLAQHSALLLAAALYLAATPLASAQSPCNPLDRAAPFGTLDAFDTTDYLLNLPAADCPPGADDCLPCNTFDLGGPLGVISGGDIDALVFGIAQGCPAPITGACCTAAGCDNTILITEDDCLSADQTNTFVANADCADPEAVCGPLAITGACCTGDGVCEVLKFDQCDPAFFTAGATCEEADCDFFSFLGACCINDDTCFEESEFECLSAGGSYSGPATFCALGPGNTLVCDIAIEGACCLDEGFCIDGFSETLCVSQFGTFAGVGATCDDTPNVCGGASGFGACCFEGDLCLDLSAGDCGGNDGTFAGDSTSCSDTPSVCEAPQPTSGACCFFRDTDCSDGMLQSTCLNEGGTYQGDDTTCASTQCPTEDPRGACCLFNGCSLRTAENCVNDFGEFFGVGTQCTDALCQGACCSAGGETCTDGVIFGNCFGFDLEFLGIGTDCATSRCTIPETGACCSVADGTCTETTELGCFTDDYQGDGATCADSACPIPPVGACCPAGSIFGPTTCFITSELDCTDSLIGPGTYFGNGTTCECPQVTCDAPQATGACCTTLIAPLCLENVAEADCFGTYFGDDSLCINEQCPPPGATGACCTTFNNECTDGLTEGQCFGIYFGDGTECATQQCPPEGLVTGACCSGFLCIDGLEESECTDGTWLGEGTDCLIDQCP
ncbi:MAG: hypothetical protein AAGI30_11490 [Planctomycetota bacterium]